MPVTHYLIRYRCTDAQDRAIFVVDDEQATAYLFSGGQLQLQCVGAGASERLVQLLAWHATWAPVPRTTPYTMDGLRRLASVKNSSGTDICTVPVIAATRRSGPHSGQVQPVLGTAPSMAGEGKRT
jgi:hypothetical protein